MEIEFYQRLYNNLYKEGYHASGSIIHIDEFMKHLNKYAKINKDFKYTSILDIGCSSGNSFPFFKEINDDIEICGIEVSEIAIKKAVEKNRNVIFGSVTKIPHYDNSFDLVISIDVMEHLHNDDVEKAISELYRVSKKYIALKIATTLEVGNYFCGYMDRVKKHNPEFNNIENVHLTLYDSEKWKSLFDKNKFKLLYEDSYYDESKDKVTCIYLIYEVIKNK